MRIAFVKTLTELVASDSNVVLVTGDLGFSVYEDFQKTYPKQYLNAGVAEQNLAGVSAGLALEGKIPVMYSIVPFITMRNYEQIRNDVCYQNLNVKVVGVGAGFSYGIYGHTHYGLEDLALMRTFPNMTIFSPGDPKEVAWATRQAVKINGPCYIRLGKAGEPTVHREGVTFSVGKGVVVEDGEDVTLAVTGVLLPRAMEVAMNLRKRGITSRVISMHTIVPLDKELIVESSKKTKVLVSLEEHFVNGGLGSAVSEVLAEAGIRTRFRRFGVEPKYFSLTGSQEYMRTQTGLGASQLEEAIVSMLS